MRTKSGTRVLILQIDPPEHGRFAFGANNAGFALLPDGKNAAYVATENGQTALWIRPLDWAAGLPFWSPDSRSIAFFAVGKLRRVDVAGGAPQTICEAGLSPGG